MDAHQVFLAYSKKVTKIYQNLFKNICTNVSRLNIFFPKTSIFLSLSDIELKFCPPGKNFPTALLKLHSECLLYHFKESLFRNMFSFFKNSRHWARKNRPSFKTFPAGLSKLFSTCPEDQSGKKNSYLFVSYPFRTLREICLAFVQSFFSRFVKNKFYMSIETIQISPKKRIFFRTKISL